MFVRPVPARCGAGAAWPAEETSMRSGASRSGRMAGPLLHCSRGGSARRYWALDQVRPVGTKANVPGPSLRDRAGARRTTAMKPIVIAAAAVLALPALVRAQGAPPAPAAPAQAPAAQPAAAAPAQKSLAQQWGLYVFPAKQQTKETQEKDEYDCYGWAKQSTGIDPLAPAQAAQAEQTQPKPGGAVRGAAKGAAVGAAIGAIAGDAGKGAAIGAVGGGVGGRAGQKQANAAAQQKAQDEAKQAQANTKTEFNKAFGACLEGKGYTVK